MHVSHACLFLEITESILETVEDIVTTTTEDKQEIVCVPSNNSNINDLE